jgi:hypothetical protein
VILFWGFSGARRNERKRNYSRNASKENGNACESWKRSIDNVAKIFWKGDERHAIES